LLLAGLGIFAVCFTIALLVLWLLRYTIRPTAHHTATASSTPSPHRFVSDAVFQNLLNRRHPAAVFGDLAARLTPQSPPKVLTPTVVKVTDDDKARLPAFTDSASLPKCAAATSPQSASERHSVITDPKSILEHTDLPVQLRSPVWPVCCTTLAMLINSEGAGMPLSAIEEAVGPLDMAFVNAEIATWGGPHTSLDALRAAGWQNIMASIRDGGHKGAGLNAFTCPHCYSVMLCSCAPFR